ANARGESGGRRRGKLTQGVSRPAGFIDTRNGGLKPALRILPLRSWSAHQFAAAIGTDVIHLVTAIGAEGAFERADVGLAFLRGRRPAAFAFGAHFQSHYALPLYLIIHALQCSIETLVPSAMFPCSISVRERISIYHSHCLPIWPRKKWSRPVYSHVVERGAKPKCMAINAQVFVRFPRIRINRVPS